jgi:Concanavalin A-like lectin/glucanases superfamily
MVRAVCELGPAAVPSVDAGLGPRAPGLGIQDTRGQLRFRRSPSLALGALAVAACSFSASAPAAPDARAPDAAEPDAPRVVAGCNTPDASGLVACFEFEDALDDGALDDSSPAHRHAETFGLTQVPREWSASTRAAHVGPEARSYLAQTSVLELASGYTLAAWVSPDSLPEAGTARGILDHERQYAMIASMTAAAALHNRCQHAGVARYAYTERLPVGAWSFLACTWDGTRLCAYRWASATDHEHHCHVAATGPGATGAHGLAIGHLSSDGEPHSRFAGALDGVQLYARGLTAPQLCALIGQPADCLPCDTCE